MPRKSLDEILRYLKPFTRYEGIAIHEFKVPEVVHGQFPQFERFKEILTERMKKTSFSHRSTSKVTLFERLQSLGALDAVLSKSVIEEVQMHMEFFEIDERLRLLENKHESTHNYAAEFHRNVLRAIHGHVLQLHKILRNHQVGDEWLNDYISAGHKHDDKGSAGIVSAVSYRGSHGLPHKGTNIGG